MKILKTYIYNNKNLINYNSYNDSYKYLRLSNKKNNN